MPAFTPILGKAPVADKDGRFTWPWQKWLTDNVPNFSDSETPAGTIDGANKVFTLLRAPTPSSSLHLYLSGSRTAAYALNGNTITMTSAPAMGATLLADYRY